MSSKITPARRFAAAASVVQIGFGVALFADPYRWARAFRWRSEPETDVGLYFGRCLGAVAIGGGVEGLRAARDPRGSEPWFRFTEAAAWLLAAVHVRQALEGRQPVTETLEIPAWAALAVGARRYVPS